jgi:hypothetical protein
MPYGGPQTIELLVVLEAQEVALPVLGLEEETVRLEFCALEFGDVAQEDDRLLGRVLLRMRPSMCTQTDVLTSDLCRLRAASPRVSHLYLHIQLAKVPSSLTLTGPWRTTLLTDGELGLKANAEFGELYSGPLKAPPWYISFFRAKFPLFSSGFL